MLYKQHTLTFVIADNDSETLIKEAIQSIDINIHFTSVYNGGELIELLLKTEKLNGIPHRQPDAIILDLHMPILDGLSTLRVIKANPMLHDVPVFILYSFEMRDYSMECRSMGIAGLYVKPCTTEGVKYILKDIYSICGGIQISAD